MKHDGKNLRLRIRLTPKASNNSIQGWAQDGDGEPYMKVRVTAAPDKGKANKALIDLLSAELGVPRSNIEILKGATDRNKIVIIHDIPDGLPGPADIITGLFS